MTWFCVLDRNCYVSSGGASHGANSSRYGCVNGPGSYHRFEDAGVSSFHGGDACSDERARGGEGAGHGFTIVSTWRYDAWHGSRSKGPQGSDGPLAGSGPRNTIVEDLSQSLFSAKFVRVYCRGGCTYGWGSSSQGGLEIYNRGDRPFSYGSRGYY